MEPITREIYELHLKVAMLKHGDEFQAFFSQVMELRYGDDFCRVCPWGQVGDLRCDGFRKSIATVYQVYAPDPQSQERLAQWLAKMDADCRGAVALWDEVLKGWTFVTNREAIPAPALHKLQELQKDFPGVTLNELAGAGLRRLVFELSQDDITRLLGNPVLPSHMQRVGFADIQVVVDAIVQRPPASTELIRPVPPGKLEANTLSDDVAGMLRWGMQKADEVARFFANWHEKDLGDRIAKAFNNRYVDLRTSQLSGDQIFYELWLFAAGSMRRQPVQEAAVMAILSHLFESCDIFEEPRLELSVDTTH